MVLVLLCTVRFVIHVEEALLIFAGATFSELSVMPYGMIQILICLGSNVLKSSLSVDDELVELYLLNFLLLNHKLCLIIRQLLAEPFNLLFKVLSHFVLLGVQEFVNFQLAIKFLFRIFYHEFHLSYIIFELVVFDLNFSKSLSVLLELSLLLLHFLFVLVKSVLQFERLLFLCVVVVLDLL